MIWKSGYSKCRTSEKVLMSAEWERLGSGEVIEMASLRKDSGRWSRSAGLLGVPRVEDAVGSSAAGN